jgi:NADH-quinone oxidoreductase subunit A
MNELYQYGILFALAIGTAALVLVLYALARAIGRDRTEPCS